MEILDMNNRGETGQPNNQSSQARGTRRRTADQTRRRSRGPRHLPLWYPPIISRKGIGIFTASFSTIRSRRAGAPWAEIHGAWRYLAHWSAKACATGRPVFPFDGIEET
jgi:hypothetical protein